MGRGNKRINLTEFKGLCGCNECFKYEMKKRIKLLMETILKSNINEPRLLFIRKHHFFSGNGLMEHQNIKIK